VASLLGFAPVIKEKEGVSHARLDTGQGSTYSYGGEDILELVHERDQAGVVDVDATDRYG
jgi:hypothetical protein